MRPLRIALGDLSYFNADNVGNLYVPLNLGYLASYVKAKFGRDVDMRLFKDPHAMLEHVKDERPDLVGLSAYYWQEELDKLFVRKVREIDAGFRPYIVIGGPSVDSDVLEQRSYLDRHRGVDKLVVNEGEDGLAAVVGTLLGGSDAEVAITHPERVGLSTDLASVPSPYLDGTLDEFLDGPFQPMLQTSRLCPYTCLAGDTPINTIFGDISIRELAEKYGDAGIPVYTFNLETRDAFIADSVMIRKYGENQHLVRVHFDDGTHIDCTPDHKFLQISRGCQWECEASSLPAGSAIRAMRVEVNPHLQRAYVTWARRDRRLRSRMIKEYEMGRRLASSEHVHHVDRNTLNDAPENLVHYASAADHLDQHPEIAERMRTNNPTKGGMSQEWLDNLAAANRGKVRSHESRLRYRKSKLGTKNPNFKDGASSIDRKSRIAEINHRVVSVDRLAEKGDVYCLTVPATGWFFANNVLVKNCSFCVSGKSRGKLRVFPMEQVNAEIEFIAKRFADRPDHILYIVDENFGILGRDVDVAKSIRRAMDYGYPKRVFYYNDKRFTQTSRDVQEVLGNACHHGVCLSLQSENPETLKAIRRRNLTDDDVRSAIAWAHGLGLMVSTELIFGLPCETRASFLALLDKCARLGFDKVQCYNLIVFDGIEMNRQAYRDEHKLVTKRRPINAHSLVLDGEACAETEEVVVQSSSISFDDYRLIRAMNVMFHAVFVLGVHREFFRGLVDSGQSLTAFFEKFLEPLKDGDWTAQMHRRFIADLEDAICDELGGHVLHDGRVVKIQPVFASKLAQATWVPEVIARIARQREEIAA